MSTVGDDGRDSPTPDTLSEVDRLQAENEALRHRLDLRMKWRRWLALLMVVLTSISVVAATVAVWAHRTVFDTDEFMETIQPALDEPAFYSALSTKVSDQIIEALDIETRVTAALTQLDEYLTQVTQELIDSLEVGDAGRALLSRLEPPSLVGLAGPVTDWIESRVELRTEQFVSSDEFTSRFPELVRQAHEATIALVRDELAELPNVYTEGGEVRLNLIPIIAEALRAVADEIRAYLPDIDLPDVISNAVDQGREQLAAGIKESLPEDFGQVTIMSEDSLDEIQSVVRQLDRFVWLLVILAVVLAAVTILLSPTRRRTGIQLSIGVALGFFVSALIVRGLESRILEEITNPDGEVAARALLGEILTSLGTLMWIVALAALVAGIAAYLAGRPPWLGRAAEGIRHLGTAEPGGSGVERWVAAHADLLRLAGIGVAVALLFLTGLELVAVIVIGAILALLLWAISTASAHVASPDLESVEPDADRSEGVPTP